MRRHKNTNTCVIKTGICQYTWNLTNYSVLNNTHYSLRLQISSRILQSEKGPDHRPIEPLHLDCHSSRQNDQFSPVSRRWPVKLGQWAVLYFLSSLLHHCLPNIASLKSSESIAPNLKSQSPFFKCIAFQRVFFLLQESLGQQSIRGGVIEGAVRG